MQLHTDIYKVIILRYAFTMIHTRQWDFSNAARTTWCHEISPEAMLTNNKQTRGLYHSLLLVGLDLGSLCLALVSHITTPC